MKPITLTLPEPPSLNDMIDMAKRRVRRGKKSIPVYYFEKEEYSLRCVVDVKNAGVKIPRDPWPLWKLSSAHFKLHNERDPLELLAGLKWTVDALVNMGLLANDSPRHLKGIPDPTQEIDRKDRCVIITITPINQVEEM